MGDCIDGMQDVDTLLKIKPSHKEALEMRESIVACAQHLTAAGSLEKSFHYQAAKDKYTAALEVGEVHKQKDLFVNVYMYMYSILRWEFQYY